MARRKVEVDLKQAVGMLMELKGKDFEKVYRSAVRSGANVLKRETDKLYATRTKLSQREIKPTKKGKKPIKPGQAKVTFDRYTGIVKVHILKDYMMKWFEMGTKTRVVKRARTTLVKNRKGKSFILRHKPKSRFVGYIRPTNLFKEANQRVEKEVYQAIGRRIMKVIKKINNKKR